MITIVFNLVLCVAMAMAVGMFIIFARDTSASRRVLAGADGEQAIAVAKLKVARNRGAEVVAVIFAIGVGIGFLIIN